MKKLFWTLVFCQMSLLSLAQNPLFIPPTMTGTVFNLTVKDSVTQFFPGIYTNTYGINNNILGPTLIVNKGDFVQLNVTNTLTGFGNSTTIHWHGLHVPADMDGGPHQIINQGSTWNAAFKIMNNAGTFWYHPHGEHKTDRHVSKGLAGMLIVKDDVEASLTLPRTYGVDDFPIVIQTKAFDVLNQIAVSTEEDTLVCVNGTPHSYLNTPAQVVRMRLLNGSSMRSYNIGFTDDMPFHIIASDGGLLDAPVAQTRLLIAPGERYEILIDLQGLVGDTIDMISYGSEMPNGIYGAATVTSMMGGTIPGYDLNPLNGADFQVLEMHIVPPTSTAVTTIPSTLISNTPWSVDSILTNRTLVFRPDTMGSATGAVIGPFNISGFKFDMDIINITTYLNHTEKWRIQNQTGIAHPFHIHDVQFYLLNINGGAVPAHQRGMKDVVLVQPMEYIEFITKFEDFANDSIPYMYHCHLLHHEDDGMMGSFRVIDTSSVGVEEMLISDITLYPNPSSKQLHIQNLESHEFYVLKIVNVLGEIVWQENIENKTMQTIDVARFSEGMYSVNLESKGRLFTKKCMIQR